MVNFRKLGINVACILIATFTSIAGFDVGFEPN